MAVFYTMNPVCPITQCPFEEPIMAPCCGNSFEREALTIWLRGNNSCPLCKESLSGFDPQRATLNRSLIPIQEPLLTQNMGQSSSQDSETVDGDKKYKAETMNFGDINVSRISLIDITRDDSYVNVIMPDYSGSMSGSYWNSCINGIKYLESMFPNKNIYIAHNHEATVMSYNRIISLYASGGNSFDRAFTALGNLVLRPCVKRLNVIFMTDGIDSFTEEVIKNAVKKHNDLGREVVIHSFGIGSGHYAHIIDPIRKLGNTIGVYCFADTSSNGSEEIYTKINLMTKSCLGAKSEIKISGLDSGVVSGSIDEPIVSMSIPKFLKIYDETGEYEVEVSDVGDEEEFKKDIYSKILSELATYVTSSKDLIPAISMTVSRFLDKVPGFDDQKRILDDLLKGKNVDKRTALDLTSGIYTKKVIEAQKTTYEHNATTKSRGDKPERGIIKKLSAGNMGTYDSYSIRSVDYGHSHPSDFDMTELTSTGNNMLHVAALSGNYEAISDILDKCGYDDSRNNSGLSPMMQAAVRGWWISVGYFLDYGHTFTSVDLLSCIVYCANHGYPKTATRIYEYCKEHEIYGLDVDMFGSSGRNWFYNNASDEPESINSIIESGNTFGLGSVKPGDIEWYHFHESIQKEDIFLGLLDILEDISILEDFNKGASGDFGSPIIFMTISKNKKKLFDALIKKGANIHSVNFKGNTPVYMAAYKGSLDMFCSLIDLGADPNVLNWDNESPLMPACQYGHTEIVSLLLEYGLEMWQRNNRNESPLSSSVRLGRNNCLKILFDFYGGVENKNNRDRIIDDMMVKPEVDGHDCIMSTIEMNRGETFEMIYEFLKSNNLESLLVNDRNLDNNEMCPGGTIWHMMAYYNSIDVFEKCKTLSLLSNDILSYDTKGLSSPDLAINMDNAEILRSFKDNDIQINKDKIRPGTKCYELFFDPLFAQVSSIDLKDSVDQYFAFWDSLIFTKKFMGNLIKDLRGQNGESWLHVAAKYDNDYLFDRLIGESFNLDLEDNNKITPRFWAAINNKEGYKSEKVEEIKKMFKGSLLLLFKIKSCTPIGLGSNETKIVPANYGSYSGLSGSIKKHELFSLKTYIIEVLCRNARMNIQEIILSWFIENDYSLPEDLNIPVNHELDIGYQIQKGTSLLGIDSVLESYGPILDSPGTFIDKEMNETIVYELRDVKVFKSISGLYYLPKTSMIVDGICRANKYSIIQKNIRQTSYALTAGQVTGLLVSLRLNKKD